MIKSNRLIRRLSLFAGSLALTVGAAFAAAVAWPTNDPAAAQQPGRVAITNVAVLDIRNGRNVPNQTVILSGNEITFVGPADLAVVPSDAKVIDGTSKYVMPALWDMHAHVYAVSPLLDMALYIAYGVTNVRDMQGCPAPDDPFIACYQDKKRWTEEAVSGKRVSPRIFESSSFMANGPGMADRLGNVPAYFDVATPQQARSFVRHYASQADTIKVYDGIPRDAYFALADEASKMGLALVGHKPRAVSAIEAAKRQRSIEHARFVLHESYDGSDDLRNRASTPFWREDRRRMVDHHDAVIAARIFDAMRSNGTYYVPTHLTRWSDAYADKSVVREDPALAYLHPLMKMQWMEDVDSLIKRDPAPADRKAYLDFYEKGLALTKQAHDAGVKVMVGSDYIVAGLDVHREMEQLVEAGLTPRQALAAATLVPAEYAHASNRYGEVAVGNVADLIVLTENPLADIRNTQSIWMVVFNGAPYDHEAIARIKKNVEENARSWTIGAKILWRFLKNPASY